MDEGVDGEKNKTKQNKTEQKLKLSITWQLFGVVVHDNHHVL